MILSPVGSDLLVTWVSSCLYDTARVLSRMTHENWETFGYMSFNVVDQIFQQQKNVEYFSGQSFMGRDGVGVRVIVRVGVWGSF